MFKRCKVVMLPTNNKAIIGLLKGNKPKLFWHNDQDPAMINHLIPVSIYEKQHLYILSDDEIKEGDWCLNDVLNEIRHVQKDTITRHFLKIIATTDSSLMKTIIDFDFMANQGGERDVKLPSPSDSFITKYVTEYNKDNKIEDVMVEYEDCGTEDKGNVGNLVHGKDIPYQDSFLMGHRLKVDHRDNNITIKKIKDS